MRELFHIDLRNSCHSEFQNRPFHPQNECRMIIHPGHIIFIGENSL